MASRALGWRRDPPKAAAARQDLAAEKILGADPLPASASLRDCVLSVLNQGSVGSCVANAFAQAIRIAHVVQGIKDPELASRLWIYWMARATHFETLVDEGTYGRAAAEAVARVGFCSEADWPYSDAKEPFPAPFQRMPNSAAFRAAYDQRGDTAYHKIQGAGADRVLGFKRAIARRMPVIFGTQVSDAFCAGELGPDPVKPPIGLSIAGGHEMVAVDYETSPITGRTSFLICNSWGEDWGDDGFVRFDEDYIAWPETRDPWLFSSVPVPVKG